MNHYEIFCDIAEEMIENGEVKSLEDSKELLETIAERAGD